MSEVSNTQKMTNIVVLSHVKRRIKAYFVDKNSTKINLSMFPQYLIISLITVLEDILTDSLKYVVKNEVNGLYVIDMLVLGNVLNANTKYNFFNKYTKQYSNIQYEDNLFFNLTKVLSKLESKHGDKLMISTEVKKYISYLLVSLQYDICDLSQKFLRSNDRVTMSKNILLLTNEYILGEEINTKIKLKLDCIIESKTDEKEDTSDEKDDTPKKESTNNKIGKKNNLKHETKEESKELTETDDLNNSSDSDDSDDDE